MDEVVMRRGFSPNHSVFPVSIIQPMLHTCLHLRVAFTRRTNGRRLETFQGSAVSEIGELSVGKLFHFLNN
jgi:hypothetical protein